MNVTIKVDLKIIGGGSRLSKSGLFTARSIEDIPSVAYNFVKQIRREISYRDNIIEKVTYNGTEDITVQVKTLDEAPILDLPFYW